MKSSIILEISSLVNAWHIKLGSNAEGISDADIGGFPNVSGNAFLPVPGVNWHTILAPYLCTPSQTLVSEGKTVKLSIYPSIEPWAIFSLSGWHPIIIIPTPPLALSMK